MSKNKLRILKPSLTLSFNNKDEWGHQNCYAYALNSPNFGCVQPGQLNKRHIYYPFNLTARNVLYLLQKEDGLIKLTEKQALSGKFHSIALRIAPPNEDFHFYRMDHTTGTWSHKFKGSPPQNVDDDNKEIRNPRLAADEYYEKFCGYLAIPSKGVLYFPKDFLSEVLECN